jgi:hypothetical protein
MYLDILSDSMSVEVYFGIGAALLDPVGPIGDRKRPLRPGFGQFRDALCDTNDGSGWENKGFLLPRFAVFGGKLVTALSEEVTFTGSRANMAHYLADVAADIRVFVCAEGDIEPDVVADLDSRAHSGGLMLLPDRRLVIATIGGRVNRPGKTTTNSSGLTIVTTQLGTRIDENTAQKLIDVTDNGMATS